MTRLAALALALCLAGPALADPPAASASRKVALSIANQYGDTLLKVYADGEVNISMSEIENAATSDTRDQAWAIARAIKCATDILACRPDRGR